MNHPKKTEQKLHRKTIEKNKSVKMSPSYGMITEPLSDLSLGTRGHSRSLLKLNLFNELGSRR